MKRKFDERVLIVALVLEPVVLVAEESLPFGFLRGDDVDWSVAEEPVRARLPLVYEVSGDFS